MTVRNASLHLDLAKLRVIVKSEPLIEIDDGRHHDDAHRHGGGFCPSGQAKKGRC